MPATHQASNIEAEIAAISADVISSLRSGTDCSWTSLLAHFEAGKGLNRLKLLLPHGQFGNEVEKRFHISRQWSSQLMKLARNWPEVEQAIGQLRPDGFPRASFSVEGALALLKKKPQGKSGKNTSASQKQTAELEELRSRLQAVMAELEEARFHVRSLEAELRRHRPPIDPATKERAEKIAALWRRPGFVNEGRNAELRLRELAQRFRRTLADFLAECGIGCPVNWTDDGGTARAA